MGMYILTIMTTTITSYDRCGYINFITAFSLYNSFLELISKTILSSKFIAVSLSQRPYNLSLL